MSLKTTLEALGNQVRRLSGKTNKMSLDAMTQELSNISLGSNVSGADAATSDVIAGKKFVGANGTLETGSMTNRGAVSKTLNTSTKSYTIPSGYHNGSGKVSITTQEKSVTPGTSAVTVTPDTGKLLSKVTVKAVTSSGKQVYSGTLSVSSGVTSISINTGKTITSSFVFLLFAFGDGNRMYTHLSSAQWNGSTKTMTFANPIESETGYSTYSDIGTSGDQSMSYSGTTFTLTSNYFGDGDIEYTWYLVQ